MEHSYLRCLTLNNSILYLYSIRWPYSKCPIAYSLVYGQAYYYEFVTLYKFSRLCIDTMQSPAPYKNSTAGSVHQTTKREQKEYGLLIAQNLIDITQTD